MNEYLLTLIIETIAITVIGSLLHFTYEWSSENKFVGIFSAVNESTWEHIKLALSGIFCCMLVDVWIFGDNPNYWLAKSLSFIAPVIVIPILFYGYTALTKKAILPIDILSFIIAAFVSVAVFIGVLMWPPVGEMGGLISMVISVVILAMYLLFTKFPLHNFLFQDPINHHYGYAGFHKLWPKRNKHSKQKHAKSASANKPKH